jgi:hypothetical protein
MARTEKLFLCLFCQFWCDWGEWRRVGERTKADEQKEGKFPLWSTECCCFSHCSVSIDCDAERDERREIVKSRKEEESETSTCRVIIFNKGFALNLCLTTMKEKKREKSKRHEKIRKVRH